MPQALSLFQAGNLGNIVGPGSDGALTGILTPAAVSRFMLKAHAAAALCITDNGGLYVNESVAFAEATGDDVELLTDTPADDDAVMFGHATVKFGRLDINITTTGVGTWTLDWEYWNGTAWAALEDLVDGTEAFVGVGTGWKSVTFTVPTDWVQCTVDSVLGYWIRAVVDDYSALTTLPQAGQGYVRLVTPVYTNDTTDFNSAGAGDVALLPAYPLVGDTSLFAKAEKFCKLKVTTSQARTGTATFVWKYWNGTTWAAIPIIEDDSVAWSGAPGTHLVHFVPPADWVACTAENGPDGVAGFFIGCELTELTDVTAQPLASQGWVLPLTTGATGITCPHTGNITKIAGMAQTKSGTTADSVFLLWNCNTALCVTFTWTKAVSLVEATVAISCTAGDKLLLIQVTEDGSTELANAQFWLTLS